MVVLCHTISFSVILYRRGDSWMPTCFFSILHLQQAPPSLLSILISSRLPSLRGPWRRDVPVASLPFLLCWKCVMKDDAFLEDGP
jgi:hypothetical protein